MDKKSQKHEFPPTVSVNGEMAALDSGNDLPNFGRYKTLDRLAEHGQAVIYLAYDPNLGRQVVVKVSKFTLDPEKQAAVVGEGKSLARLDHPNLAQVYELDFDQMNRPYMVMEYIEGRNLAEVIKHQSLSVAEIQQLIKTVAMALQHAHDVGVVHRDIKPANIIIRKDGVPKIIDFGLAQASEAFLVGSDVESSGGTIPYMSPEQARSLIEESSRNEDLEPVDELSDIFSLGAVFYELLTGKRLYDSFATVESGLRLAVNYELEPAVLQNVEAPQSLKSSCEKAIHRIRFERFQSAAAFAESLNRVGPNRHSKKILIGLAAIAVVLITWFSFSWLNDGNSDTGGERIAGPIQVEQFDIEIFRNNKYFCRIDELNGSLMPGDAVRFLVQLSEPGYLKLAWLDSTGSADEVFPMDPEKGHLGDHMIQSVSSPAKDDHGWPLDPKGNVEFALLLVGRDPNMLLTDKLDYVWQSEFGRNDSKVARFVTPLAGKMKTGKIGYDRNGIRGLQKKSKELDIPILQLMQKLQRHAESVHAIRIPISIAKSEN